MLLLSPLYKYFDTLYYSLYSVLIKHKYIIIVKYNKWYNRTYNLYISTGKSTLSQKCNEYGTAKNRYCIYFNFIKHLAILFKWHTVFNQIIFFNDEHRQKNKHYNYWLNSLGWLNQLTYFKYMKVIQPSQAV